MAAGRPGPDAPLRAPGPVAPGLRIGLLGGSFNPAHQGHRHISELAVRRLGLDYVWWLVSPGNPLKPNAGMGTLQTRLESARGMAQHPRLRVCALEEELGTRYTVDTLAALERRFPKVAFVWLMGSDNLLQFAQWRDWPRLARLVPIAVVPRPGSALAPLMAKAAQRFAKARVPADAALALRRPPAWAALTGKLNPESATAMRARRLVGSRAL